jgi:hypothetical protein
MRACHHESSMSSIEPVGPWCLCLSRAWSIFPGGTREEQQLLELPAPRRMTTTALGAGIQNPGLLQELPAKPLEFVPVDESPTFLPCGITAPDCAGRGNRLLLLLWRQPPGSAVLP